ncbi:putative E3 ubiquitin-protein ligase XBAT35 isoform X1 [Tanacetum coccineum]
MGILSGHWEKKLKPTEAQRTKPFEDARLKDMQPSGGWKEASVKDPRLKLATWKAVCSQKSNTTFTLHSVNSFGDDNDDALDDDIDESSDEETSEYDEFPPFKRLTNAHVSKLSKEEKKSYYDELEYREKLFMKKQLKEEKKRRKMMKKMAEAAKIFPTELTDNNVEEDNNHTHRYRVLDSANQWLIRPVLDPHGWDHDVGYEGINVEHLLALKEKITVSFSGQWMDKEGKTPLILASMNPQLYDVAKTLIELGANVNAYRPGRHAGTPLHHAAKRGLEQMVKLLLLNGANALVMNDDCQTALDVARVKGYSNVVRAIESHICLFSGWLLEHYGPGFLEVFAPQLLSRKVWVVILPCGALKPTKPYKLELAIYSSAQDAKPRTIIPLWKANMDEPNFNQPDPAVIISNVQTAGVAISYSRHTDLSIKQLSNDDVAAVVAPSVSILEAHNGSLILKQDLETHPDIIDTDMKDASDPNDSEKGVASYENLDGALVDAEMGNTHVSEKISEKKVSTSIEGGFDFVILAGQTVVFEGSPDVGKTSLVLALGRFSGHSVVRINLSEQADTMNLLGSDLRVESDQGMQFAWSDGILLQAVLVHVFDRLRSFIDSYALGTRVIKDLDGLMCSSLESKLIPEFRICLAIPTGRYVVPTGRLIATVSKDCLVGKQQRNLFPQESTWRASQVLELVHADICGPINPLSNSNKSRVEKESGVAIKGLRTDRGGEFTSVEFTNFCNDNGKEASKTFWPEAVNWTVHILNRSPTLAVRNICPEEAWSGFKPSVAYFKVFGSIAYVHIPDCKRIKLDDKSKKCVFIGVSEESKAYRLYDLVSKNFIVSRFVRCLTKKQVGIGRRVTRNLFL